MGFASAMAWLLFAISMVVTLINIGVSRRFVYYQGARADERRHAGERAAARRHRVAAGPLPTVRDAAVAGTGPAERQLDQAGASSSCC